MSETVDRIDDVIAYIESPEYLRMVASLQGESAYSLLSGSRTQAWQHVSDVYPGATVRILVNRPWSAPLVSGQLVQVISEVCDAATGTYVLARDEQNRTWWIPTIAFERVESSANDGLADRDLELLANAPYSEADIRVTSALYEALPEPEPEPDQFDFDERRFGIQWSNQEEQCVCPGCVLRRNPPLINNGFCIRPE
jgi:hypothetical protein